MTRGWGSEQGVEEPGKQGSGRSGGGSDPLGIANPQVGRGGKVVAFCKNLIYPPYWKNNLLAIPFNRSLVLGPLRLEELTSLVVFW